MDELNKLFPHMPKTLEKALRQKLGELAENDKKTAPADPLETAKPLKDNGEIGTPPPTPAKSLKEALADLNAEPEMYPADADLPRDPPPNKPGQMGNCGATCERRLPNPDEFIDEGGTIRPHGFWSPPKAATKRRKLTTLNSLADVQRELAKLYADYHHLRINAAQYTRGVYGLSQLATIMRMADKSALAAEAPTAPI